MRAITLTQPWCGLMAAGIKRIENRKRPLMTRDLIGQDIAFHASREIDEDVYSRIDDISPGLCRGAMMGGGTSIGDWWHRSRVTSAITHVATLVDILTSKYGYGDDGYEARRREFDQALARGTVTADQWRWYFAQVGYVFNDERVLETPVPCRGWQGCWTLDGETERKVRAQLAQGAA